jgi:hypothetical protein
MPRALNDIHSIVQKLPHVPYGPDGSKRIIVDTGSPMSFGNVGEIELAEHTHTGLKSFPSNVRQYMPDDVVALIGMDIIKQYDFEIDLETQEVIFSKVPLKPLNHVLELEFFMGSPTIVIDSPKGTLNCLIDTGAHLSYIASHHTEAMDPMETTWDFNPFAGVFDTNVYSMHVTVKGKKVMMNFGNLPELLETAAFSLTGLDAVVEPSLFPGKRFIYSSSNKQISFE